MEPGTSGFSVQALRSLLNELRNGTGQHPDDADVVLTRLEEQLGVVPATRSAEPPVADWDEILPAGTLSAACQRNSETGSMMAGTGPDWKAANRALRLC